MKRYRPRMMKYRHNLGLHCGSMSRHRSSTVVECVAPGYLVPHASVVMIESAIFMFQEFREGGVVFLHLDEYYSSEIQITSRSARCRAVYSRQGPWQSASGSDRCTIAVDTHRFCVSFKVMHAGMKHVQRCSG